jgi:hypothetical protein
LTVAYEGLEIRLPGGEHDGQGEIRREGTA